MGNETNMDTTATTNFPRRTGKIIEKPFSHEVHKDRPRAVFDASRLRELRGLKKSFFVMLLFLSSCAFTGFAEEGNVVFQGNRFRVYFQPRQRATGEGKTLRDEIGRLNYITILFENYLEYLDKMGKIASTTHISLEYNPEGDATTEASQQRVLVRELGINSLIATVNAILLRQPGTFKSFLVTDRESLLNIKDQVARTTDTPEQVRNLQNLSPQVKGIEPDIDFAIFGNSQVVALRPTDHGNAMVKLTPEGDGTVLCTPNKESSLSSLRPYSDGRFIACAINGEVNLFQSGNKTLAPLFPSRKKTLMDMEWAPVKPILAGMVIDRQTLERQIFLYDAEKGEHLRLLENNPDVTGDYQFVHPFWSRNGKKILFCSGDEIHCADLEMGKVFPRVATSKGAISEIMWAPDSQSFAFVDVFGQARDKHEFNSTDFQQSVLHRIRLTPSGQFTEDETQTHISSDTLKLVGFWDLDRVLFLEGKLQNQRLASPLWDLGKVFSARVTVPPKTGTSPSEETTGPVDLLMEYCYAFRKLDGKFKNVYDSGFGRMNQIFTDSEETVWFLGVKVPEGVQRDHRTYCMRPIPYPFQERNRMCFPELSKEQAKNALDFLASYNLRKFDISPDLKTLFVLSNSAGISSIWAGAINNLGSAPLPKDVEQKPFETLPFDASDTAQVASAVNSLIGSGPMLPDLPDQ